MEIGDRVQILEEYLGNRRYNKYIIIQVIPKEYYNMYLCKSVKYGFKTTFTDFDVYDKIDKKRKVILGV